MKTIFQVSTPTYWGFRLQFESDKLDFMSNNDIIEDIKKHMKAVFRSLNLEDLYEGVDNLDLHIEEPIIKNQVNFVCDHKHS